MLEKIRRVDPRWLFLLFFLGVFFDAFFFNTNMKHPGQLLLAIAGAFGTDLLINWIKLKKIIFPWSGLVSSCGSFILITSPMFWPYFLLGSLAIYSKHFITWNGRHIFNPVNFGAVLVLFYCNDCVMNGGGSWSGNMEMIPYLVVVGTLLTIIANRFVISAAFVSLFFLYDYVYIGNYLPANIKTFAAPAFMLFVFFMISDPRTTPTKWWQQILFAACIVVIEGAFKLARIPNGVLWSLFIVSFFWNGVLPIVRDYAIKFNVLRTSPSLST